MNLEVMVSFCLESVLSTIRNIAHVVDYWECGS